MNHGRRKASREYKRQVSLPATHDDGREQIKARVVGSFFAALKVRDSRNRKGRVQLDGLCPPSGRLRIGHQPADLQARINNLLLSPFGQQPFGGRIPIPFSWAGGKFRYAQAHRRGRHGALQRPQMRPVSRIIACKISGGSGKFIVANALVPAPKIAKVFSAWGNIDFPVETLISFRALITQHASTLNDRMGLAGRWIDGVDLLP